MPLRAHYFKLPDTCIHCGDDNPFICRATVFDGQLRGIALMCESCGIKERDLAIEDGVYEFPKDEYLHEIHNRGEKN